MTTSIVTGAAGFIGSHLTDRLLNLGHQVLGIDCFTDYYPRPLKENNLEQARGDDRFRLIEGDLLRLDLGQLLDGVDYVFHLAGQAGVRASWGTTFGEYVRNNISATQRLLEAAKGSAITKFIYSSSSSVYGDAERLPVTEETLPRPVSPYGVTKLAAEHLCSLYAAIYGLPALALRLFTVYGPRQRPDMAIQRFLSAELSDQTVPIFGDGTQTRDFTFVSDVIEAHILAAKSLTDERIFNICGGSRISVNELLTLIQEVTGKALRIEYVQQARGDARHTFGDNTRARQALGFRPRTRVADGIEAQWRWVHERKQPGHP